MQEKAIETALKKNKSTFNPIGNADVVKSTSMMATTPTSYRLSPEVYEYMKNNHLCFRYGEKYGPHHQCKRKQLKCLIVELEPNQVLEEATVEIEDIAHNIIIEGEIEQEMQEVGCLSALNHSWSTVKETGHKVSYCPSLRVTVSDRNYVMCTSHCKGFSWKM
ncbi:hypothetical protein KY290_031296 [Solanum tuberosum]|uniref:Uncharacterized protein n=1 Tax=Solanum tuberosum TaxID=4113 RepID=A0ABQ7U9Y9_SOLTU|nr:hypothetical protein KY290_031296 [Solanum tuberosum]